MEIWNTIQQYISDYSIVIGIGTDTGNFIAGAFSLFVVFLTIIGLKKLFRSKNRNYRY